MSLALLLLVAMFCNAQMADPVKFKSHLKTGSTAEAEIVFDGKRASVGTFIQQISVVMVLSRRLSM